MQSPDAKVPQKQLCMAGGTPKVKSWKLKISWKKKNSRDAEYNIEEYPAYKAF